MGVWDSIKNIGKSVAQGAVNVGKKAWEHREAIAQNIGKTVKVAPDILKFIGHVSPDSKPSVDPYVPPAENLGRILL